MALIHADGFDHYGTTVALLSDIYTITSPTIVTGLPGMTGFASVQMQQARFLSYALGNTTETRFIGGCRCILSTLSNGAFARFSTAIGIGGSGITLKFTPDGGVEIRRDGPTGAILGTSAGGLYAPSSAFYLELKVNVGAGTAGSVEVRINNQPVLTVAGILVVLPTFMAFGATSGSSGTIAIDDLYICDGSGTENNDFLGDRQMLTTFATGDMPGNQWAVTGAPNGFTALKNNPPNPDQYISGVVPGEISRFTHQPIPTTTVDIAGVVMFARCSKSDAGIATLGVGMESGGATDYDTLIAPSVGFGYYRRVIERDPDGGVHWTYPKFNAALARVERLS